MGRREYAVTVDVVYECGRWLVQVIDGRGCVVFERAYHRRVTADHQRRAVRLLYEQHRRQLALPGIDS